MSHRIERVNSELQRALAQIIPELGDSHIRGMVSVMRVDTARDLRNARAYISIFGDQKSANATFEALVKSSGYIRKELARKFRSMKIIPEITFVRDNSPEYLQRLTSLDEGQK